MKSLASSMKCPTQQAEKSLIQLVLYLAGARDWVFKLPYVEVGASLARTKSNICWIYFVIRIGLVALAGRAPPHA